MKQKCAICRVTVESQDLHATLCREHAHTCPACERDTQRQGLCAFCRPLVTYDDNAEVTLARRGQYYVDRDRRHYALQRIVGRMYADFGARLTQLEAENRQLEAENRELQRALARLEESKWK